MENFDIVFIVLTYRTAIDLHDFIKSLESNPQKFSYKVIVVNSFFDQKTSLEIKEIAKSHKCDFIECENKGYGYGNNFGINFAKENYKFNYLVVSNADIIIQNFDIQELDKCNAEVIAPQIRTLSGKKQNPIMDKYSRFSEKAMYYGQKNKNKIFIFISLIINKIKNKKNNFINRKNKIRQIYAAHGSFVIFKQSIFKKLDKIYDENLFLFCEEGDIAKQFQSKNIKTILNENIKVLHKEDGSMSVSNININNELSKSYIYYYEKWNNYL